MKDKEADAQPTCYYCEKYLFTKEDIDKGAHIECVNDKIRQPVFIADDDWYFI